MPRVWASRLGLAASALRNQEMASSYRSDCQQRLSHETVAIVDVGAARIDPDRLLEAVDRLSRSAVAQQADAKPLIGAGEVGMHLDGTPRSRDRFRAPVLHHQQVRPGDHDVHLVRVEQFRPADQFLGATELGRRCRVVGRDDRQAVQQRLGEASQGRRGGRIEFNGTLVEPHQLGLLLRARRHVVERVGTHQGVGGVRMVGPLAHAPGAFRLEHPALRQVRDPIRTMTSTPSPVASGSTVKRSAQSCSPVSADTSCALTRSAPSSLRTLPATA